MLLNKSTRIWGEPWGGGALGRQESSVFQHRLLLGISVLGIAAGLLWGGRRRRYVLLAATALLAVTALNTIFVSESRMSLRMTPLLFAVGIGGIGAAVRARRGDDEPVFETAGAEDDGPDPDGDASRDPNEETPQNADTPGVPTTSDSPRPVNITKPQVEG
ncbi:MAG: hypothetical protein Q7T55_10310, partial [Solirubrobacteraceae bacterium]|nr:hypothetical protein [Solirubrobacteraceae bacterium]